MIQFDFFPAQVVVGGERLAQARVSIDGEMRGVVLAGGRRNEPIYTVASARIASVERDPDRGRRSWLITTVDGDVWRAEVGGGCGCGNPLKRFDSEPAIQAAFA